MNVFSDCKYTRDAIYRVRGMEEAMMNIKTKSGSPMLRAAVFVAFVLLS